MMIEGMKHAEFQKPVKEKKEAPRPAVAGEAKAEHAPAAVESEKAHKVAHRLSQLPQNSVRFIIRDLTSSKPNNVVIQIENREGKVVATIPSEVVLKMADASDAEFQEASKGLLVEANL